VVQCGLVAVAMASINKHIVAMVLEYDHDKGCKSFMDLTNIIT